MTTKRKCVEDGNKARKRLVEQGKIQKDLHIVNFSGGKDSTAMLLRMIELNYKIDKIVFADTGYEFPELYNYIKMIEKHINRPITIVYPESSFAEWFSGKLTRGKKEGETRGFPQVLTPCYWTREAKIKPLQKENKGANNVYIGIAYDEKERMSKTDGNLKYPLVEWKWTEADCIDYLNKKGLFNPLYVNFNRLGCWFCPKQSVNSLYVLWKLYPTFWTVLKQWESANKELTGRNLVLYGTLEKIQEDFEKGIIPKTKAKYDCWNGCEGVKTAFKERQKGLCNY